MCNTYPFVPTFLKTFQAIDTFIRDFGKDLLNVDVCLCKNGFPDEDTQSEMCNFSDKMGNEIFTLCRDFFNVLERGCTDVQDPQIFETFFGDSYKYGKVFLFFASNYYADDDMFRKQVEYYGYDFDTFNLDNKELIEVLTKN